MRRLQAAFAVVALVGASAPAAANNVGENYAWQFPTTADKLNQALIQEIIQKKRGGYYAPPTYITNIDRQYNCNVSSTATGNQGTNTNLGNAPTTTGPTSTATGNANQSQIDGWKGATNSESAQNNDGHVHATVDGSVASNVSGSPEQALNSEQANSGNQSASVDGSTACHFANVLN